MKNIYGETERFRYGSGANSFGDEIFYVLDKKLELVSLFYEEQEAEDFFNDLVMEEGQETTLVLSA